MNVGRARGDSADAPTHSSSLEVKATKDLVAPCGLGSWIVAGMPSGHAVMGSFENWIANVSGILEHVGISGLLDGRNALLDRVDDESATWRPFVQAWGGRHGTKPVAVGELAKLATELDFLGGVLHGETDNAKASALGKLLRKYFGRIFAAWRIGAVTRGAGNCSTCSLVHVEGMSGERSGGPSAPQRSNVGGSGERRERREGIPYPSVQGANEKRDTHAGSRAHGRTYKGTQDLPDVPDVPSKGSTSGSKQGEGLGRRSPEGTGVGEDVPLAPECDELQVHADATAVDYERDERIGELMDSGYDEAETERMVDEERPPDEIAAEFAAELAAELDAAERLAEQGGQR